MTVLPPAAPAQSVGGLCWSDSCGLQAVASRSRRDAGAGYNAAAALGSIAPAISAR